MGIYLYTFKKNIFLTCILINLYTCCQGWWEGSGRIDHPFCCVYLDDNGQDIFIIILMIIMIIIIITTIRIDEHLTAVDAEDFNLGRGKTSKQTL